MTALIKKHRAPECAAPAEIRPARTICVANPMTKKPDLEKMQDQIARRFSKTMAYLAK